jgi:O-acetyl-ADP-ribose deacetylase (regulator of RNase III)
MTTVREKISVVRGDITRMEVDCIVNAANTSLLGGGGVDGAIHRAGGPAILEACRKVIAKQGGCKVGDAVITTAGRLPAKFVIHTVGPVWEGGNKSEKEKLSSCYRNSLILAIQHGCKSIAFPNISTGVYRFPKEEAASTATQAVMDFLLNNHAIDKVIFVCFDEENYDLVTDQLKLKGIQ